MRKSITRRTLGRVALFGLALLVGLAALGPLLIMLREPDDGRTWPAGVRCPLPRSHRAPDPGRLVFPLDVEECPPVFRLLQVPVLGELMLGATDQTSAPGFSDDYVARARLWSSIRGARRAALDYVRDLDRLTELAGAYPKITAPTPALHGTADAFVPMAAGERYAPALQHATIVRLEGGSHFIVRDSADAFLRAVDAFFGAAP